MVTLQSRARGVGCRGTSARAVRTEPTLVVAATLSSKPTLRASSEAQLRVHYATSFSVRQVDSKSCSRNRSVARRCLGSSARQAARAVRRGRGRRLMLSRRGSVFEVRKPRHASKLVLRSSRRAVSVGESGPDGNEGAASWSGRRTDQDGRSRSSTLTWSQPMVRPQGSRAVSASLRVGRRTSSRRCRVRVREVCA